MLVACSRHRITRNTRNALPCRWCGTSATSLIPKPLSVALSLSYDKDGSYTQPENMCSDTSYGGFGGCGAAGGTGDWDTNSDLRDLISDGFLSFLPKDPTNNTTYYYSYEPWNANEGGYTLDGQAYDLCATLEAGGSFCINQR